MDLQHRHTQSTWLGERQPRLSSHAAAPTGFGSFVLDHTGALLLVVEVSNVTSIASLD